MVAVRQGELEKKAKQGSETREIDAFWVKPEFKGHSSRVWWLVPLLPVACEGEAEAGGLAT